MMRLYHDLRAPNPRRVRMFLAKKGLLDQVELVEFVDRHPRQHDAGVSRQEPAGAGAGARAADGRTLRESMAICRYLEELHPTPSLFGADPWSRAQIEQWNRHAELEVLVPVAQVFRNSHAFWHGRLRQAPEFAEIMRELVAVRMAWLDGELATRPFLAGDHFTVADITLLCGLDFGKVSGIRVGDDTPNLKRWHQTISARPSAKA